jgi:hypothetical protein
MVRVGMAPYRRELVEREAVKGDGRLPDEL